MKRLTMSRLIVPLLFLVFATFPSIYAQKGTLTRITVHSRSLENTVTKENPDREVSIYLPPGYQTNTSKRYPVVYLLHGIGDTDQTWTNGWNKPDGSGKIPFTSIPEHMDEGLRRGEFGEMIIVMPNQRTNWFGSFYVNSTVTGNWEDFTVNELVSYIDKNYRTIANVGNRGIGGHSMGGYGAITLGMKHPDVFSVVYGMNPALMNWGGDFMLQMPAFKIVSEAKGFDELLKYAQAGDIYPAGTVTVGQAFSPNPNKPPFYFDSPVKFVDGRPVPSEPGYSKWAAMTPINMVKKHRDNLNSLRGLRFDSGYEDEFRFIPLNAREFSAELTNNGIEHVFEEYNGDHRNRIHGRHGRIIDDLLPYFWDNFESGTGNQ